MSNSPIHESLSIRDSRLLLDPEDEHEDDEHAEHENADDHSSDGDTASQRSISLSSPPHSPRASVHEEDTAGSGALPVSEHADPLVTPVSLVRQGLANAHRASNTYTLDTDLSSERDFHDDDEADADDRSSFMRRLDRDESPFSSVAPSLHEKEDEEDKENVNPGAGTREEVGAGLQKLAVKTETETEAPVAKAEPEKAEDDEDEGNMALEDLELEEGQDLVHPLPSASLNALSSRASITSFVSPSSYPPPPRQAADPGPRGSVASFASGSSALSYSKKVRPESMLIKTTGPLVLGIALVDFNHLVGPKIEYSKGDILEDEELAKILPFLALPDGAHQTVEDYSYFHLVPSRPNPSTIFGISCNRQIRTSDLLVKDQDVTRSTVQKAVVVLAAKPLFGPIRDRLGVITRALFAQRDFSDMSILDEFHTSLELSLRGQLTESGLYMGTSLRELVHTFRQRTLTLLKALMLQKKIMFYGHPVEKLCTYQYSLVALVPGLLQNLDDCGSPPLAQRAATLSKPTELRTSDPKSMMAYTGLPLDLFGKDAFFQPYLPLQQLDMLKDTRSWLCGSTNSIVAQQKEVDLLINLETGVFEFRDPKLERSAGLTAADRKWMDDIVTDVNDGWDESDPMGGAGIQ
ncbi:hypothetical protein EIP86_005303 [Pleurotus ostreatoroseus]|nr:hypothetical protein EIP86_005303 [Pleurotus ostreatoroseus]